MAEMKLQFPRIYRLITEKRKKEVFKKLKLQVLVILFLASIFLIFIFSIDLISNIQKENELKVSRLELEKEVKGWQSIADKYQENKQAYLEISLIEYRLGNFDSSKYFLNKALFIDPNFKEAKNLQEILNSKY